MNNYSYKPIGALRSNEIFEIFEKGGCREMSPLSDGANPSGPFIKFVCVRDRIGKKKGERFCRVNGFAGDNTSWLRVRIPSPAPFIPVLFVLFF